MQSLKNLPASTKRKKREIGMRKGEKKLISG